MAQACSPGQKRSRKQSINVVLGGRVALLLIRIKNSGPWGTSRGLVLVQAFGFIQFSSSFFATGKGRMVARDLHGCPRVAYEGYQPVKPWPVTINLAWEWWFWSFVMWHVSNTYTIHNVSIWAAGMNLVMICANGLATQQCRSVRRYVASHLHRRPFFLPQNWWSGSMYLCLNAGREWKACSATSGVASPSTCLLVSTISWWNASESQVQRWWLSKKGDKSCRFMMKDTFRCEAAWLHHVASCCISGPIFTAVCSDGHLVSEFRVSSRDAERQREAQPQAPETNRFTPRNFATFVRPDVLKRRGQNWTGCDKDKVSSFVDSLPPPKKTSILSLYALWFACFAWGPDIEHLELLDQTILTCQSSKVQTWRLIKPLRGSDLRKWMHKLWFPLLCRSFPERRCLVPCFLNWFDCLCVQTCSQWWYFYLSILRSTNLWRLTHL